MKGFAACECIEIHLLQMNADGEKADFRRSRFINYFTIQCCSALRMDVRKSAGNYSGKSDYEKELQKSAANIARS